jgi:hypothetical protein
MFGWISKTLGIDELRRRLDDLEGRMDTLESEVERGMRHFHGYKDRSKKELVLMKNQITDLLQSVEALINHQENKESLDRALNMRKRLRNNLSRIEKNLSAKAAE